jgi:hypothetical protein
MAPPYSTSSAATLRIPLHRFATQLFFSVLATLVPSLLQKWNILPLSGLVALVCGAYSDFALTFRDPLAKSRSPQYCISLSMSLGYLHQAITVIGERLLKPSSGFSQTQHVTVHFCFAFFVISEFEFYRAYINFRNFESGLDPIKYFLVANVEPDHVFPTSRDPWGFGYMPRTKGPNFETSTNSNGLYVGQWLLFWIIGGLANLHLKRMVDPSWNDGKDLLWAMLSTNVLFTTENVWTLFLHLPLLRVVRQANHVASWAMVGLMEWWNMRAEARDESASDANQQVE